MLLYFGVGQGGGRRRKIQMCAIYANTIDNSERKEFPFLVHNSDVVFNSAILCTIIPIHGSI